MKVEFLLITPQDDSFCDDKDSFNNLLRANSGISVEKRNLKFKQTGKEITVKYLLDTGDIEDKKQRYFHVMLDLGQSNPQPEAIEQFNFLIRTIKKILSRVSPDKAIIDIIWNDITLHYSMLAYPIINEIENLMRKLIIKFMVINVGIEWTSTTTPDDLKNKLEKKSNNSFQNLIYETDFIQLSHYLFSNYRVMRLQQLETILRTVNNSSELDIDILKNYLPKSNWERYFEGKVIYGAEKLKEEWQDLYELRNKIAHNRGIEKKEYDRLVILSNQLHKVLTEAIKKLESGFIEVTEEQKQEIQTEIDKQKILDSEDKFLKALEESENWLINNPNPNAFIGVNYFITTSLVEKGISEDEGKQLLYLLKDKKVIDVYKHEDLSGLYPPVSAIRKIK